MATIFTSPHPPPPPRPPHPVFPTLSSFFISSDKVPPPPSSLAHHSASDQDLQPAFPDSVLFFSDRTASLSPDRRNRLIGLAHGLLNFSALLGSGLHPSLPSRAHQPPGLPNSSSLRVVHSRNQKMLFYEPEPGFHIFAVISIPADPPQPSKIHSSFNLVSSAPQPAPHEPSDAVLLNSLRLGFLEYRLLNGAMSPRQNDRQTLVDHLERFWSVWLWRWNVEKTGCGGVDFDEYFGSLQSPLLDLAPLPKPLLSAIDRFIHHTCPPHQVLPILIHNGQILHMPSPVEPVSQQDLAALARYLLSLLGGSEAKTRPVKKDEDTLLNRLSSLELGALAPQLDPPGWAHKALSWASTSFVFPQSLGDDSIESLDEQLRADMGLPTTSPARLRLAPKAMPSDAALATLASNPTPVQTVPTRSLEPDRKPHPSLPSDRSRSSSIRRVGSELGDDRSSTVVDRFAPPALPAGYPHSLLAIYPPHAPEADKAHYPHHLDQLYPAHVLSFPPSDLRHPTLHSRPTSPVPGDSVLARAAPDALVHDPRSPRFNVEFALSDAMSEQSIGLSYAPAHRRAVSHSSHLSLSRRALTGLKRIRIFVGDGKVETEAMWLQHEGWNLALVVAGPEETGAIEKAAEEALLSESRALLQMLSDSNWPSQVASHSARTNACKHRFLVKLAGSGLFAKQSSGQSKWLGRNEIWTGKQTEDKEVEVSGAIVTCCSEPNCQTPEGASDGDHEEIFIRTASGQWVVHKQMALKKHKERLDAYLVLPTGSGTLINADVELRKLERDCERLKIERMMNFK